MKINEVMGQWLQIMLVGCSGLSLTACVASQAAGPGGLRPAYDRIFLAGDILVAETHLRDFGYDPGPVDGVFTAETQAAVRAYQRRYGLVVTGFLDYATRRQLLSRVGPAGDHALRRETRQCVGRWAPAGVVLLCGLLTAQDVAAWGDTGHRIICEIAFQELIPQVRARVIQLLRQAPDVLWFSEACTWPDHPRTRGRVDGGRPVSAGRYLRRDSHRRGFLGPLAAQCIGDGQARGADIPRVWGGRCPPAAPRVVPRRSRGPRHR